MLKFLINLMVEMIGLIVIVKCGVFVVNLCVLGCEMEKWVCKFLGIKSVKFVDYLGLGDVLWMLVGEIVLGLVWVVSLDWLWLLLKEIIFKDVKGKFDKVYLIKVYVKMGMLNFVSGLVGYM